MRMSWNPVTRFMARPAKIQPREICETLNSESNEMNAVTGPRKPSTRAYLTAKNTFTTRSQNEITIHELWQILVRRRVTFFVCFAAATLAAGIISLILPARYEGVGRLTVDF